MFCTFCFFYIECGFKLRFFFLFFFSPTCLGKKKNILAFAKESLIYFNKSFLLIIKCNEWCSKKTAGRTQLEGSGLSSVKPRQWEPLRVAYRSL